MRAGLVTWLVLIHAAAILLFSRGFLLSRLALSDVSKLHPNAHERPQQTHKRAVILIVDALRFDFCSPNPPEPRNPYHHHVLTLPAELTKAHPGHSFLFNAYADPPTTTLQRIKALTTGSLPTFVDMGSNFGGSAILEDSIVKQMQLANKSIAFMGDDTWLSVFPSSFHPNLTFPYDSFNVEDLHTVDTGVLTHLFPLLRNSHPNLPLSNTTNQFDFLIGHFLGVDHVGHRVGPSHPSMHAKLTQLDTALRQVVQLLDDETLLVVLGDHGMDRAGDHGGDGVLETSSALWIYSKGPALMDTILGQEIFPGLVGYKTFPGEKTRWRSVQQIDLVPSLSMLLGLPIPYNNLGSVIPELFWRSSTKKTTKKTHQPASPDLELEKALTLNSLQINQYLQTYRTSSSGSELDSTWSVLQQTWDAISIAPKLQSTTSALETKLVAMANYNRTALSACRAIWAQFNPVLMAAGLAVMVSAVLTTWLVYLGLSLYGLGGGEKVLAALVPGVWKITFGAGITVFVLFRIVERVFSNLVTGVPMNALEVAVFIGPMLGCVFICVWVCGQPEFTLRRVRTGMLSKSGVFGGLVLVLHTLSFFSNSFTFWEDRVVLWLAASSVVPMVLWGVAAPGLSSTRSSPSSSSTSTLEKKNKSNTGFWSKLGLTSLRGRILGFTFLFLVCIRLMSLVTVCREEQGAHCHVTFYATPPSPSLASTPASPLDLGLGAASDASNATAPEPMTIVPTSTTPPAWSLILSLPTALALPFVIARILKITKSDNGIAPVIIWGVVTPALVGSWVFWMLEWAESGGMHGGVVEGIVGLIEGVVRLRSLRSWIARGIVGWVVLGSIGWWMVPLCLDIRVSATSPTITNTSTSTASTPQVTKTQVTILGYANAYGAPYLLCYLLVFAVVYLCTPLPGQVVLGLSAVALVSYLEAVDAVRDVREIEKFVGRTLNPNSTTDKASKNAGGQEDGEEPTAFVTTLPLILLSFTTFFATGHQSTVSSIQWKTGFVLSESVRYPWSVISVVLNSAGAFLMLGLMGGALLGGWKRAPSSLDSPPTSKNPLASVKLTPTRQGGKLGEDVEHSSLLTTLPIQLYFLTLLLGASTSAAVLRRHLMVWKVFAPRFMAAVVELGVADLGVLVAWGVPGVSSGRVGSGVVRRVVERVGWVLGRVGIGRGGGAREKDE